MARRNGRPGAWLASDDYTGVTCYASELQKDFWGAYSKKPLKRNLQEISSPLADPYPVDLYRGPTYEASLECPGSTAPFYVGNTTIPTNPNNAAFQALNLDPAIPDMAVECTFIVR